MKNAESGSGLSGERRRTEREAERERGEGFCGEGEQKREQISSKADARCVHLENAGGRPNWLRVASRVDLDEPGEPSNP